VQDIRPHRAKGRQTKQKTCPKADNDKIKKRPQVRTKYIGFSRDTSDDKEQAKGKTEPQIFGTAI